VLWYFLSFRTNTENASFQHNEHRWYQFKRFVTVAAAVTTDVQSALHQHTRRLTDEYATDSLPHRWCCDPSRTTPLSVTPSSGWRHEFLSGRHASVASPRSQLTVLTGSLHNFYQHSIFPADYHFGFVYAKLRKRLTLTSVLAVRMR